MIFDLDEFQEAKEKRKLVYKSPLPKKKQRMTVRGRSSKPKIFTKEEIIRYEQQLSSASN